MLSQSLLVGLPRIVSLMRYRWRARRPTYCSDLAWDNLDTLLIWVDKENLLVSQLLSWNKANCSLSVFDKENLIESPLDLLYYIYNYYCGYVSCLPQFSCPSADFFVICCDCDLWLPLWHDHFYDCYHTFCDSMMVMWYFPMLHPSNKEKKY